MRESGFLLALLAWMVAGCEAQPVEEPRTSNAVGAWVLACQNADGGFGSFPGDISAVRATACALETLAELEVPVPEPRKAAAFLASRQNADGGFRGRPWGLRWADRSTLIDSYHAVRALEIVGEAVPRGEALAAFAQSRQRSDGGFHADLLHRNTASCANTFYAVSILKSLGAEVPRREAVVAFLRHMQADGIRGDGGFISETTPQWQELMADARAWARATVPYRDPGPEEKEAIPVAVGYTSATYFAVAALALIESSPADPKGAVRFLASQQGEAGGFLTGMGDYGAYHDRSQGLMSETGRALAGLRLLCPGGMEGKDRGWTEFLAGSGVEVSGCASWIESCQNADGGFARRRDEFSRPSDMEATWHAVRALALLGSALPEPAEPRPVKRETLPPEASFPIRSAYFQPNQAGQALFLHRIAAPIRREAGSDEATAVALMRWVNQHVVFSESPRNEAALIVEDGRGTCGAQARCLVGLLEAEGIPARFLLVRGHCVSEAYLDGRWCLLDTMFDGAFRQPDGRLYSAFGIKERHRRGEPDASAFGDSRYETITIYWPQKSGEEIEIHIGRDDTADSPSVRRAYPGASY